MVIYHIVHTYVVDHVWLFQELHCSCMWQLFKNYCKCVTKATIMLQLMYNIHTCNHAACPHLHHPLWDTFAIIF
jgi:hypothetical protein